MYVASGTMAIELRGNSGLLGLLLEHSLAAAFITHRSENALLARFKRWLQQHWSCKLPVRVQERFPSRVGMSQPPDPIMLSAPLEMEMGKALSSATPMQIQFDGTG